MTEKKGKVFAVVEVGGERKRKEKRKGKKRKDSLGGDLGTRSPEKFRPAWAGHILEHPSEEDGRLNMGGDWDCLSIKCAISL